MIPLLLKLETNLNKRNAFLNAYNYGVTKLSCLKIPRDCDLTKDDKVRKNRKPNI